MASHTKVITPASRCHQLQQQRRLHLLAREATVRDPCHARATVVGLLAEAVRQARQVDPDADLTVFYDAKVKALRDLEVVQQYNIPMSVVLPDVLRKLSAMTLFHPKGSKCVSTYGTYATNTVVTNNKKDQNDYKNTNQPKKNNAKTVEIRKASSEENIHLIRAA